MKKTKLEEKFEQKFDSFFEDNFDHQQISIFQTESALENPSNIQTESLLDNLLLAIKLIFLYAPGVIAIQLVGHYLKSFILFGERMQISWLALSELAIIGIFLTMMGIGKLTDLKYLKVPAYIFAFSALLVVIEAFFTTGSKVELPELFRVISLSFPIALGYFVKKALDEK